MRARVFVTLKPSVFDPQGKTIADALQSLGYRDVGVGEQQALEVLLFGERPHRIPLHPLVRLLARNAFLRQLQQHTP